MINEFYTNTIQYGNKILVRSIRDGLPQKQKIDFYPTLYTTSGKSSESSSFKSLHGVELYEIKPGTINDCKDFIKTYENAMPVYGQTNYAYQYIEENYKTDIKFDSDLLKIIAIDIETANEESGFPHPKYANEEILLITVRDLKTKSTKIFGSRPYEGKHKADFVLCKDENQLLQQFVTHWQQRIPDIITGWNIDNFDIPYIINRLLRTIGEDYVKKLSPWNIVNERSKKVNNVEQQTYEILGVSSLDYIELYKKYSKKNQESYRLDHIAFVELGERKLDHSQWNTFKEFYSNDWTTYTDYNYHDVLLIDKLDEQLKFIELQLTMAYTAKINYQEAFSPVRLWDSTIYHYLINKNIIIPNMDRNVKGELMGAYVKTPITGIHKWIASFDLASLYPHLIMQYNISPETLTTTKLSFTIDNLLDKIELPKVDYAITANGWCYSKDKRGFLPELMDTMYANRSMHKKQMLKHEQQYESDKNNKELSKEISRLNNLQLALKETLNSAYGAIGMPYFRYYDLRMAESITSSGQFSIKWIANRINKYLNSALKTNNTDYIIASDTDSVYVSLETLVETTQGEKSTEDKIKFMDSFCGKVLTPLIEKSYIELAEYMNAYEQKMQMKREVLADKGLWTAKKRYALRVHNSEGVQYDKPKMKIMGIEIVKSSTPTAIREKLKSTIDIIFNDTNLDLIRFIEDTRQEFKTLAVEDIAIPSTVNGMIKFSNDKTIYSKGCPIYVRGGLLYNKVVKDMKLDQKYPLIGAGDKLKYVYLKLPNTIKEDVIGFPTELPMEFGLHKYIDYNTQFEKVFLNPLEKIVDAIGWNLKEQSTLDAFF